MAADKGRMGLPPFSRWLLPAVAGLLALHAAHTVLGLGERDSALFNTYLYDGLMAVAALMCFVRAASTARERAVWLAFGLGLFSYFLGEVYWSVAIGSDPSPPVPSPADAFYLGFYPPAYVGVVLLARSRLPEFRPSLWLDGAIGALAIAAVGVAVLFQPVLAQTNGDPAAVATNLAYPLADLLLAGMVVALVAATGWQPGRTGALVAGSLVIAAVADGIYLYQSAAGTYVEGYAVDSAWLAANLLLGWAALQPASRTPPPRMDRLRMVAAPTAFGLAALGVLVYGTFADRPSRLAVWLVAGALLAVICRMVLSFRENLRLLSTSRQQASIDPLTGLHNRRILLEDLERAVHFAPADGPRLLVLLDLNRFKAYNDAFGHPAGDALLDRVGRRLSEAAGPSGRAYRLGGDEFCALVEPGTDGPQATAGLIAREAGEEDRGVRVDACCGFALVPDEATDPGDALSLADQRLYVAKAHGRRSLGSRRLERAGWTRRWRPHGDGEPRRAASRPQPERGSR